MLMRRATASVSFHTQVVLVLSSVILRRSSLLKCVSQPKISKKFTLKTLIFGVQSCSSLQGHRCWYPR